MYDLVLRNARVEESLVDIGIISDRIVEVFPRISSQGVEEIECGQHLAIPGFIDCHLHLDKSLIIERADYKDVSGPEKGAMTREQKGSFTKEDIRTRAEKVIMSGLMAGNLSIRTSVDVDPIVGLKGIEALLELKSQYSDLLDIQIAAFAQEGIEKYPETETLLIKALEMGSDLIGGHTIVDTKGETHIDKILGIAEEFGVEAEFHLDESGKREHFLLPYLAREATRRGLCGRVTGIHCCTLSALSAEERGETLDLIAECLMKIIIAPTAISTRELAPVKELLASGATVGIGSDNTGDFFNPVGRGDIRQAALLLAYVQRFFTSYEIRQLWEMITSKGADLLGCKEYGIRPGNRADITVLNAFSPAEALYRQTLPNTYIRRGKDRTERIMSFLPD